MSCGGRQQNEKTLRQFSEAPLMAVEEPQLHTLVSSPKTINTITVGVKFSHVTFGRHSYCSSLEHQFLITVVFNNRFTKLPIYGLLLKTVGVHSNTCTYTGHRGNKSLTPWQAVRKWAGEGRKGNREDALCRSAYGNCQAITMARAETL